MTLDELMSELVPPFDRNGEPWREFYAGWCGCPPVKSDPDAPDDVTAWVYGEGLTINHPIYAAAALLPHEEAEEICRRLDKIAENARRILAARGVVDQSDS